MSGETPTPAKLTRLADEINDAHRQAERSKGECQSAFRAYMGAAIKAGQLLVKAKRLLGHGKWMDWLAHHCPEISDDTARRWMRAAERAVELRGMKDVQCLTDLYREIGLLPEKGDARQTHGYVDLIDVVCDRISGGVQRLRAYIHDTEVSELPADKQAALRTALEPLVAVYRQLARPSAAALPPTS